MLVSGRVTKEITANATKKNLQDSLRDIVWMFFHQKNAILHRIGHKKKNSDVAVSWGESEGQLISV